MIKFKLGRKKAPVLFLRPEMVSRNLAPNKSIPLSDLISRLNDSLPSEYVNALHEEFVKRHPERHDFEFDALFVELKRFFVLSFLFRGIPVYSSEVQRLWADMALYTEEYRKFGEKFFGKVFPYRVLNEDDIALVGMNRPTYDFLYGLLFQVNENNHVLCGRFFEESLPSSVTTYIRETSDQEILNKYFQPLEGRLAENLSLVNGVIRAAKELVSRSEHEWESFREEIKSSNTYKPSHHEMLFMFVMVSMYHDTDNFSDALLALSNAYTGTIQNSRSGSFDSNFNPGAGGFDGGGDGGFDGGNTGL